MEMLLTPTARRHRNAHLAEHFYAVNKLLLRVSSRFGRKKTMLGFSLLKSVGFLMSIFGNSYTIFVIGRFLVGCGFMGVYLPAYVLR